MCWQWESVMEGEKVSALSVYSSLTSGGCVHAQTVGDVSFGEDYGRHRSV